MVKFLPNYLAESAQLLIGFLVELDWIWLHFGRIFDQLFDKIGSAFDQVFFDGILVNYLVKLEILEWIFGSDGIFGDPPFFCPISVKLKTNFWRHFTRFSKSRRKSAHFQPNFAHHLKSLGLNSNKIPFPTNCAHIPSNRNQIWRNIRTGVEEFQFFKFQFASTDAISVHFRPIRSSFKTQPI